MEELFVYTRNLCHCEASRRYTTLFSVMQREREKHIVPWDSSGKGLVSCELRRRAVLSLQFLVHQEVNIFLVKKKKKK